MEGRLNTISSNDTALFKRSESGTTKGISTDRETFDRKEESHIRFWKLDEFLAGSGAFQLGENIDTKVTLKVLVS